MTWWHRLFHRRQHEEQLENELRHHLDLHASDLISQGYSPEEAQRQAHLALGGPEQVKELCRDARGTRWLNDLVRDLRYAVRILAKQPGFTLVAVLTLGLGIGVNAAILSAVNGFILRPLSADRPEELFAPHWGRKADAQVWDRFSYANYLDVREQNKSFTDLCAFTWASAGMSAGEGHNAVGGERADVVWGELVSGNYFDVMGVKPILGRGFLPEENLTPNTHPVVVLSHYSWQRRFDADPAIVGKSVFLNGTAFTVVGVAPEPFLGSVFYFRQGYWVPLMMAQKFSRRPEWRTDRTYQTVNLYGRLKPGVTLAQAEADLNLVA